MKKRKKHKANPHDNPLGVGLSTKQLVWIGVGLVGAVALVVYLKRKKAAAAGPQHVAGGAPAAGPCYDPFINYVVAPRDANGNPLPPCGPGQMAGVDGPRNPASVASPAGPPPGPSAASMPQSPPRIIDDSRGAYTRAGGFSGMGDGGLRGANGRL